MNETQRRFLRNLRDAQPNGLRRSSVPATCADLVKSLQTCRAVAFVPAPGGRGVVLSITDPAAFVRFVGAHCPHGLDVDVNAIADRADAIYQLADAKAIRQGTVRGIFVRSTKPGVVIQSTDGEASVNISDATDQGGGAGIQLSAAKQWTFSGTILVVENEETFWKHEMAVPDADMAIFASGPLSNRLISWLSAPEMATCPITHWGDYDPYGVCEYMRLVHDCGDRVSVYAPAEVDQLLPKHGKRMLVTRQSKYLDRLRSHQSDPYVRRMTQLFDKHRKGLEQELLLRSPN